MAFGPVANEATPAAGEPSTNGGGSSAAPTAPADNSNGNKTQLANTTTGQRNTVKPLSALPPPPLPPKGWTAAPSQKMDAPAVGNAALAAGTQAQASNSAPSPVTFAPPPPEPPARASQATVAAPASNGMQRDNSKSLFLPPAADDDDHDDDNMRAVDVDIDELASDSDSEPDVPLSSVAVARKQLALAHTTTPVKSSSPALTSPVSAVGGSGGQKRRRISSQSQTQSQANRPPPLPHYTVVRALHNSKASPHRIKINSGVTDGIESLWPSAATRVRGATEQGKLSWYECQPPDGVKHSRWLEGLGKELAQLLHLDTPTAGGKSDHWVLDSFPEHYLFTIHHTPGKSSGNDRLDAYLFGSRATAKFRTVNEFTPHLFWLLQHGPDDNLTCECKYCTKKSQAQVNSVVGLTNPVTMTRREGSVSSTKRASSATPSVSAKKARRDVGHPLERGIFNKGDYVRDRPKRKTGGASGSDGVDSPTVSDSMDDSQTDTFTIKYLPAKPHQPETDRPTYRGTFTNKQRDLDLDDGGRFRRGELVMVVLDKPLVGSTSSCKDLRITTWPALIHERTIESNPTKDASKKTKDGLPQIVNHHVFKYHASLLALSDECWYTEDRILPWLGSSTPDPAVFSDLSALFDKRAVSLVWNKCEERRPKLDDFRSASDAITALAIALQIGSGIRSSFGWESRYKINSDHIITDKDQLSKEDEPDMRDSLKSWHFQQMWWGAESIWSGELVRLMTNADSDFWPEGLKPSGRVDERGHFLRITGVWKHESADEGKSAAIVSGQVYELREIDSSAPPSGSSTSKGSQSRSSRPMYMPAAPDGYEFARVGDRHTEMHVDASFIAGRYYELPESLNKRETIKKVLQGDWWQDKEGQMVELWQRTPEQHACVLAGLTPAALSFMNTQTWKSARLNAVCDAQVKSFAEFLTVLDQRADNDATFEAPPAASHLIAAA